MRLFFDLNICTGQSSILLEKGKPCAIWHPLSAVTHTHWLVTSSTAASSKLPYSAPQSSSRSYTFRAAVLPSVKSRAFFIAAIFSSVKCTTFSALARQLHVLGVVVQIPAELS